MERPAPAPMRPALPDAERAIRTTGITLHSSDGSHPNAHGTYLAACVLYAALTAASPVGLGDGGLAVGDGPRVALQQVAWRTHQSRLRRVSPEVGIWPLAAVDDSQDLVVGEHVSLGGAVGPGGSAGAATQFGVEDSGGVRYASIPYIKGLNASRFTLALRVHRADWALSTAFTETILTKAYGYRLTQTKTSMTAAIYTVNGTKPTELTFSVAGLAAGWHHIALTYDGAAFKAWVDAKPLKSAAVSGDVRYYKSSPSHDMRFNGIGLGCRFHDVFDIIDGSAASTVFTGRLSQVRLFDVALGAGALASL